MFIVAQAQSRLRTPTISLNLLAPKTDVDLCKDFSHMAPTRHVPLRDKESSFFKSPRSNTYCGKRQLRLFSDVEEGVPPV